MTVAEYQDAMFSILDINRIYIRPIIGRIKYRLSLQQRALVLVIRQSKSWRVVKEKGRLLGLQWRNAIHLHKKKLSICNRPAPAGQI